MLKSLFVEDLFESFYSLWYNKGLLVQQQDSSPIESFYLKIINDQPLTQNQGNFLLKLLEKYKTAAATAGLDYIGQLQTVQWRTAFRELDLSKKIYVEADSTGKVWVCIKFPYQLKKEFELEIHGGIPPHETSIWDSEKKVRCIHVYDANLIQLYEFAQKHNFEIDDTFMIALGQVEEIWQNLDQIVPSSSSVDGTVYLNNATDDAAEFWNNKAINTYAANLLLAKSMGHLYQGHTTTLLEKIACSPANSFWIKDTNNLFDLYNAVNGNMCVILDRASDQLAWLKEFVAAADRAGVPRAHLKVCFRDSKKDTKETNTWIKEQGIGGSVDSGRIFIFEFKPAKWLFKQHRDVKLLVTNNLYPTTNMITKDWLASHPCVIYLGNIKPSTQKGHQIVEL